MQTVYATNLPLPTSNEAAGLETAAAAVNAWTERRFGVTLAPLQQGNGSSSEGADLEWTCRFGRAGGLFSLEIDQVNSADPGFRWRTLLHLGVEDGRLWLRLRVQLYSALDGLVARPKYAVGRPGIVRDLVDAMDIRVDGRRLGTWELIDEGAVDAYVAHLLNETRLLPVVAISTQGGGQPFMLPAHLADRLLGIAHVVLVPQKAAYLVSDAIGKGLSCYLGALRIYWPGFTRDGDPYHHRAYVGGTLSHLGTSGVIDDILDLIGRSAGLSIGEPPLRRQLRLEERAEELAERAAASEAARARLDAVAVSEEGGVDAETWAFFSADYDQAQLRLQQAEVELLDAAIDAETLRAERDRATAQARELAKALTFGRPAESNVEVVAADAPATVAEAVLRASASCSALIFLPEAISSAEDSQYDDPARVLADLTLLNDVAEEWRAGLLPAGPHEALKSRCNGYRDGVSDTAIAAYPSDYRREYEVSSSCCPHSARHRSCHRDHAHLLVSGRRQAVHGDRPRGPQVAGFGEQELKGARPPTWRRAIACDQAPVSRPAEEVVPSSVEVRWRPVGSGDVSEVILHEGLDSFASLAFECGA